MTVFSTSRISPETRPIAWKSPDYSKVIVVEATTSCNLSCAFCAHDSRLKLKRPTIPPEKLRHFIQVVGEYAAASQEKILVSWLGGEPFLLKHLMPLTEEGRKNHPLHFSATTNGTRLSDPVIGNHIRGHYSELTISIDGLAEAHDQARGQSGLFKSIKSEVRKLVQEAPHLKLRVNSILMRNNFSRFPDLCTELATWGIQEITFNQLGGRDRPEFYPDNRLTPEQASQLPQMTTDIEASLRGSGTRLVFSGGYFNRISASTINAKLPIIDCKPGKGYLFVSASGTMSPCAFTGEEYGMDISSLRSADDFANLHAHFHMKKSAAQASACQDCPCTNVHGKFS